MGMANGGVRRMGVAVCVVLVVLVMARSRGSRAVAGACYAMAKEKAAAIPCWVAFCQLCPLKTRALRHVTN